MPKIPHISFTLLARCGDVSHYSTILDLQEGSVKVTSLLEITPYSSTLVSPIPTSVSMIK
jgi:hypothetical protein